MVQNTSLADGSPMPNSPSSMVNQYRLEEDEEEEQQQDADTKDIFITVDNPESHVTAIETFIMYRVLTKVRRLFVCMSVPMQNGKMIVFSEHLTVPSQC